MRRFVTIAIIGLCSASTSSAAILYVDDSATGANNGTSWLDAYTYLQDALAEALSGDEIRVAQGAYRPERIARGADYYYPRDNVEQAARSFFYACSIEDTKGVASMLAPKVLAELKGTELTAFAVLGEENDAELVRQLRGDWPGKKAAVQEVIQAWNRFPLQRLWAEPGVAIGFGLRYFATAWFEGAPEERTELGFIPDRTGGTNGPLLIDTLPPWLEQKEPGSKALKPPREKLPAAASEGEQGIGRKLMP